MTQAKNQGFALVLVIIAIFCVGIMITVLTAGTRSLTLATNRCHAQAIEANLQKSGLAWIKHGGGLEPNRGNRMQVLGVQQLSLRPASLVIHWNDPNAMESALSIETSCQYGKQKRHCITHYDSHGEEKYFPKGLANPPGNE